MKKEKKNITPDFNGDFENRIEDRIITDPNGSYTGVCEDEWEEPVQDVDDL